MGRIIRRILLIGVAMMVIIVAGAVGFVVIEHYPPLDAFYMALTTVTSVGYGEIHPLSPKGRIFNSFLIFFGVCTIFLSVGVMTEAIIELQLGNFFQQRRTRRMIDKLKDHFIVCGFGRVGRGAALEIQKSGRPVLVVDQRPDRVEDATRAGLLAMAGDSTRDEILRLAGIERARGVVTALSTDADNLFVVLSSKTLNPKVTVASRAAEEEAEKKLVLAGADSVYAPYVRTGAHLAQTLLRPHVTQFLDFAAADTGLDVHIEQVRISEKSAIVNKSLIEVNMRRQTGVVVLAIRSASGEMLFNPPADAVLKSGDYLIVMGQSENLRRLEGILE